MSCKYFILTEDEQVIYLNSKCYILPQNNIKYYIDNGLFEKNLIEWSKQFCDKDKIMLDIGSHTGTYAITLAKHCKTVYAFEPQKMTFYALCGSVALSDIKNIVCLNIGLGSEKQVGKNILNIISPDGGGSTLNTTTSSITEEVDIKTLDSFKIENVGFIKIDVEGNELNVLRGAVNTLKYVPKILFESNDRNDELFAFIKELGYKIIPISGINNMFLAIR